MEVNRRFTPGEAFDLFTLADELYPHEPRIIYYFTRVLAALSEGDRRHAAAARRVAEVMAKRWPDHHLTWYARGTSESDDRVAVAYLTKCLELRPDFVGAYAHLSYRVVSLDAERALKYADQALERAPEWPWAYAMKARALRGLRRYREALAILEQGIRLSPRDPVLVIQRGRIHVAEGDATRAEQAFREAIRLNPGYSESHTWLGFALTQARRYDAALAAHRAAIALAPDRPWPIVQLGRTLYVKGDLSGAIERFTAAIELDSTYAHAYLYRGLARRRNGDPRGALADFRKILALRPGDRRARIEVDRTEGLLEEADGKPGR
jgi:tetratricopeptide (TPR) repeat protein